MTLPRLRSNDSFSYIAFAFLYLKEFITSSSGQLLIRVNGGLVNALHTQLQLLMLTNADIIKTFYNLQQNYRQHISRFFRIHQNPKVQPRLIVYNGRRNGNSSKNFSGGTESHWHIWRMQGMSCTWVSYPHFKADLSKAFPDPDIIILGYKLILLRLPEEADVTATCQFGSLDVPSLIETNKGNWELLVLESHYPYLKEYPSKPFPGSAIDSNYDWTQHIASDIER